MPSESQMLGRTDMTTIDTNMTRNIRFWCECDNCNHASDNEDSTHARKQTAAKQKRHAMTRGTWDDKGSKI